MLPLLTIPPIGFYPEGFGFAKRSKGCKKPCLGSTRQLIKCLNAKVSYNKTFLKKEEVCKKMFLQNSIFSFQKRSSRKSLFYFKNSFLKNFFAASLLVTDNLNILSCWKRKKSKTLFFKKLKKNKKFLTCSKEKSFFYNYSLTAKKKLNLVKDFPKLYFFKIYCIFKKSFSFAYYPSGWLLSRREKVMQRMQKEGKGTIKNFYKVKKLVYFKNTSHLFDKLKNQKFQEAKFFNLNHNFPSLYFLLKQNKVYFFKSYFFSLFSIPFKNRQIHRFIYFCLFSIKSENLFFSTFRKSFSIFYLLDIFLFSFLYVWAKKQHNNNSNFWVFNKYWLFLQPLPYFFYNTTCIMKNTISSKKSIIISRELFSLTSKENIFFYKINKLSIFINLFYKFKLLKQFKKTTLTEKKVNNSFNNQNKNLKIKKGVLKTWYLDNYKAIFALKINGKKKKKKFSFYLKKLKLNSFKLGFFQGFKKEFYNKNSIVNYYKTFEYKDIKYYIVNLDCVFNKTKNIYIQSNFLAEIFDQS